MEIEERVKLAVDRLTHIIQHESATIESVTPDDEGSILLHLSNGMNLHLTSGEMEYRAEEQIEFTTTRRTRKEVISSLVEDYIASTIIGNGGLLVDVLRKVGYQAFDDFSNGQLVKEYKELFNEVIIIED
jgi:hypothetical protein